MYTLIPKQVFAFVRNSHNLRHFPKAKRVILLFHVTTAPTPSWPYQRKGSFTGGRFQGILLVLGNLPVSLIDTLFR